MSSDRRTGYRRIRAGIAAVLAAAVTVLIPSAAGAAPSIVTGGPFTYVEQDPPLDIGTGTSVSGSNFYDGHHLDFTISGGTTAENLGLESVATASTVDGDVSVVGSAVYIGDGTKAIPIGSIDAVNDGRNGTKLRINFGSDFRNAGFETGDMAPWTAVQQFVELGVTQIAGFTANDTVSYPGNSGGDNDVPVSATYNVAVTSANPPGATEGTYALGLTSDMTTKNGCDVVHGPAAYSAAFDAVAGQTLKFDWRAFAGSDAYSVFGYLLNTSTGAQTEVLDNTTTNTSGTTNWATQSVTVPANGTYRFVFVSGTYDASCGRAAGAKLYVDNFQVVSANFVDDAMVTKVIQKLTYENTSDDPAPTRTVAVTAENAASQTATGNITVNITPVNDLPVGTQVTRSIENGPGDDTFADLTGTVGFTDADDTTLTYGIDGGTPGSYTIGGTTYESKLVGTYGTVYVDDATGAYRIVPNDAAIEDVSLPQLESFTVTANDGQGTASTQLRLSVTIPPVPRNVTGVAGNSQVTVSWDQPTETTGIIGYRVTSSPGGATCTTASVATTSCVVPGLTNGTAYTFTVAAIYASATGTPSVASEPVTPVGPPTAPVDVTATPGAGRVLVEWSPPANDGGSPITGYTVTSSPGGGSCTTTGTTNCTILGLAVGTTYTFTVTATNGLGTGPASSPVSLTLRNPSTTNVSLSDSTVTEGASETITATVTGTSPTGTVEFFDGGTSLGTGTISGGTASITTSVLPAGVHSITAVYGGDSGNNASTSSARSLTVQATSAVTLAASDPVVAEGDDVDLTATVTGASPTGTVEFFDGATSLGTATVSGGVATLTTSSLTIGTHSLTAVYGGDAVNLGSDSAAESVTVKAVAAVVVTSSDTTPTVGDAVTLTATVSGSSPSGTVEFFDGTTSLGTATISDGTATLTLPALAAGSHSITATYSGDDANTTATSDPTEVTGVKHTTALTLWGNDERTPGAKVTVGADGHIYLLAVVDGTDPTGTVEFYATGGSFNGLLDGGAPGESIGEASVVNGVAVLDVSGWPTGITYSVTAVYSGDAVNDSVTSEVLPVEFMAEPDVGISANPSTVAPGGSITVTGDGYAPNSIVTIHLDGPDGELLARVRTDAHGSFSTTVDLPEDLVGTHHLVVSGTDAAGDPVTKQVTFDVQGSAGAGGSGDAGFAGESGDPSDPDDPADAADTLPKTGTDPSSMLGEALALVLAGLVLLGRSRRPARLSVDRLWEALAPWPRGEGADGERPRPSSSSGSSSPSA